VLTAGADVTLWRGRVRHRFAGRDVSALPQQPFRVDALEASAVLVKVSAVKEIGGFDEGFFMYWEDTEWSCRASKKGWVLLVQPKARVTHAVAASSTPLAKMEFMLRNRWRFVRLTAGPREAAAFSIYFLCFWLPAYALTRLVPQFGMRRSWQILWQTVAWNAADAAGTRSTARVPSLDRRNRPS
jgi:GT2 family glycosyltransferase